MAVRSQAAGSVTPLHLAAVTTIALRREYELNNGDRELRVLSDVRDTFFRELHLEHCPGVDVTRLLDILGGCRPHAQSHGGDGIPDILHFIGHGPTTLACVLSRQPVATVPLLMTSMGSDFEAQAEVYDPEAIVRQLDQSGKPRLLVLQACKTAEFAKRIAAAIPSIVIISWQTKVLDEGCHIFTRSFYTNVMSAMRQKGWVSAEDVLQAFQKARTHVTHKFSCRDPDNPLSHYGTKQPIGVPVFVAGAAVDASTDLFSRRPVDVSESPVDLVRQQGSAKAKVLSRAEAAGASSRSTTGPRRPASPSGTNDPSHAWDIDSERSIDPFAVVSTPRGTAQGTTLPARSVSSMQHSAAADESAAGSTLGGPGETGRKDDDDDAAEDDSGSVDGEVQEQVSASAGAGGGAGTGSHLSGLMSQTSAGRLSLGDRLHHVQSPPDESTPEVPPETPFETSPLSRSGAAPTSRSTPRSKRKSIVECLDPSVPVRACAWLMPKYEGRDVGFVLPALAEGRTPGVEGVSPSTCSDEDEQTPSEVSAPASDTRSLLPPSSIGPRAGGMLGAADGPGIYIGLDKFDMSVPDRNDAFVREVARLRNQLENGADGVSFPRSVGTLSPTGSASSAGRPGFSGGAGALPAPAHQQIVSSPSASTGMAYSHQPQAQAAPPFLSPPMLQHMAHPPMQIGLPGLSVWGFSPPMINFHAPQASYGTAAEHASTAGTSAHGASGYAPHAQHDAMMMHMYQQQQLHQQQQQYQQPMQLQASTAAGVPSHGPYAPSSSSVSGGDHASMVSMDPSLAAPPQAQQGVVSPAQSQLQPRAVRSGSAVSYSPSDVSAFTSPALGGRGHGPSLTTPLQAAAEDGKEADDGSVVTSRQQYHRIQAPEWAGIILAEELVRAPPEGHAARAAYITRLQKYKMIAYHKEAIARKVSAAQEDEVMLRSILESLRSRGSADGRTDQHIAVCERHLQTLVTSTGRAELVQQLRFADKNLQRYRSQLTEIEQQYQAEV